MFALTGSNRTPAIFSDPDAAMTRVALARDSILKQSNHFLIGGMIFAVLYGVKAIGLRLDLVLFDTKLFDVPYGLFVFCVLGSGSFLIAQTRFMDGHALDRRLYGMASSIRPDRVEPYYQSFPSTDHWLELTREQFFSQALSRFPVASWSFSIVGLLMLCLYFFPVIASAHYLLSWPEIAGEQMAPFQWWVVLAALILDVVFFGLVQKVYSLNS